MQRRRVVSQIPFHQRGCVAGGRRAAQQEVSSVEVPSLELTSKPPPKPDQEPKHATTTSTDDASTELIRKFAPDLNFLRKG